MRRAARRALVLKRLPFEYMVSPLERSQPEAEAICAKWQGALASIEDKSENKYLQNIFQDPDAFHWIGLTLRRAVDNQEIYKWSTGVEYSF